MECIILFVRDYCDTILVGLFVSFLWTFFLFIFRPCLKITELQEDKGKLKVTIMNKGCFSAHNIKVEMCSFNVSDSSTTHFDLDREDFLILPSKCCRSKKYKKDYFRSFTTDKLSKSAIVYQNHPEDERFNLVINNLNKDKSNYKVRVRVHGNHSLTGFGKSFQQYFRWDDNHKKFVKC